MSDVLALHRSATLLLCPSGGDVIPIHRPRDLEAHLCAWRDYGRVTTIHRQSANDREVKVNALGDDGWLVRVRDIGMLTSGWHRNKTVTRLLEDGSLPTLFGDSPWYAPDDTTDLAGSTFIAEQIHAYPEPVAQATWSWLTGEPMPNGYAVGFVGYEPVVFTTAAAALAWIADTTGPAWPTDVIPSIVDLAEELDVDRVVATSPGQITLRVPRASRRVRVQYRAKIGDAQVRVVGLTDELGHEYSMNLPGREILRISRRRGDR